MIFLVIETVVITSGTTNVCKKTKKNPPPLTPQKLPYLGKNHKKFTFFQLQSKKKQLSANQC